MSEFNDGFERGPGERHFAYSSRRRRGGPPARRMIAGGAVVLILLVAGYAFLRSGPQPEPAPAAPTVAASDTGRVDTERLDVPPLDLPDLDASDGFVRRLVTGLSSRPRLASWLVSDELVHRFVVSMVNLSGGMSPASELQDLAPEGEFQAIEAGPREVIDAASYQRYDAFAETFASLDTGGTAELYHQLHPLFLEAYRSLGMGDVSFDEVVDRAFSNLLTAEIRETPYEVRLEEGVYVFTDERIETQSEAAKQLIRMGPENARIFQAKLREIAEAIAVRRAL